MRLSDLHAYTQTVLRCYQNYFKELNKKRGFEKELVVIISLLLLAEKILLFQYLSIEQYALAMLKNGGEE